VTDVVGMEILLQSKKEENNNGCNYRSSPVIEKRQPSEQEKPSEEKGEIDDTKVTTAEMVEVDEERAIKFCQPLTNSYENIKKSSSRGSSTVQQPQQEPVPNIDHHHHRPSCAPTAPQQCYCGHCCYIDGCQGHESCFETAQAATAAETEKKKKADRKAKKILTCIITSMCLLMDCLLGIALGAYFVLGISVICCL